jgi:hypothetical protein
MFFVLLARGWKKTCIASSELACRSAMLCLATRLLASMPDNQSVLGFGDKW